MTAQERLREGEILTLERTTTEYGRERYERITGPVSWDPGYYWFRLGTACNGDAVADSTGILHPGWTIVSRRDPEPDWADADAILVEYSLGAVEAYVRNHDRFGGNSIQRWGATLSEGNVTSIRGLYVRPTDD